jgi:hypothetical protein
MLGDTNHKKTKLYVNRAVELDHITHTEIK